MARLLVDPGAEHLIPFARQKLAQLQRCIARWPHWPTHQLFLGDHGERIEVDAAPAPGCIRITGGAARILNRLGQLYTPHGLFNFKLQPAAKAPNWYDRVTAVNLAPLADATTFSVEGPRVTEGLASHSPSRALELFRSYVVARSVAARYWFGIVRQCLGISYLGRTITARAEDMLVSEPTPAGDFYVLWGYWDAPRDSNFEVIDTSPTAPQQEKYQGIIISIGDLQRQAARGARTLNLDAPVDEPGYVGPRLVGTLWREEANGSITVIASGMNYQREQLGTFPPNGNFTQGNIGEEIIHHYRPDQAGDVIGTGGGFAGWPFAIAHFKQRGVVTGPSLQSEWTYEFKNHRLSTAGEIVIEDIPLPTVGNNVSTITYKEFGTNNQDQDLSGFSADVTFFDGEEFVHIGSHTQTASSAVIDGVGDAHFVQGQSTVTAPFEQIENSGFSGGGFTFDEYIKDFDVAYTGRLSVLPSNRIIARSELSTASHVLTHAEGASFGASAVPWLRFHMFGPTWGSYHPAGNPAVFNEFGFQDFGWGLDPLAPNFNVDYVSLKTTYTSQRGVYWYRREQPMGAFLFVVMQTDTQFFEDCDKYQKVVLRTEGYRRIVAADGAITVESGYEDVGDILNRIIPKIRVDVNNFGTPAMVPWLANSGHWVIVEK